MRSLIADLRAITGAAHVLTEPESMAGYLTDWTGRYGGAASCVVRPGSVAEVAAVIRSCADRGAAIIPQGGNTGLVGGSVPPARPPAEPSAGGPHGGGRTGGTGGCRTGGAVVGGAPPGGAPTGSGPIAGPPPAPPTSDPTARALVVLSTRRLTDLRPVDVLAGQVTAGAGVTIGRLRAHAAAAGLQYGVDLASRDSATVGGTIATNAGGIHTIRYGPTRSQVLGVTAVLADGSILTELSGLVAGSSGYDLAQLLTGSEGTLAVITAARLRLWPADPVAAVLLAGVAGIEQAAELCQRLRANVPGLRAAEYLDAAGLELVCQAAKLPAPLDDSHRGYLLAEIAGDGPDGTALDLKRLVRAALPSDTAIAQDGRGQAALWAYRERLTEAIATAGIPHKIDVAVPAAALGAFRAELDEVVRAAARRSDPAADRPDPAADRPGPAAGSDPPGGRPDARRSDLLGGRSDRPGRSPGPPGRRSGQSDRRSGSPDPAADPQVIVFGHIGVGNLHVNVLGPDPADDAVDVAVARLAAAHGGSVAAEHGVGRAKTGWLSWSRSPAEISAMRAIKTALDPAGLLNPGVLLPPGSG